MGAWIEILMEKLLPALRLASPPHGGVDRNVREDETGELVYSRPCMGASASADALQERPKTMECSA